jgi:hypothetical protein
MAIFPAFVSAQELLTNGGLELVPPDDGGRDAVAPGWLTVEGPFVPNLAGPYVGDYSQGGVALPCDPTAGCGAIDAADYVVWRKLNGQAVVMPNDPTPGTVTDLDYIYWRRHFGEPPLMSLSEPSNFGHLLFEGDWQHWFQPYYGTDANQTDNFAHLMQTVPGTPGLEYTMTGWALFEDYFPGGRTNLNLDDGDSDFEDGPLSPTDSFFGLDFLDAGGNVLAGSVEIELKAAGQPSNTTWMQHTLIGVAPAGTVNVRVRATMTDGVYNPLPSPQVYQMSFFVDLFSLTAGPPGSGSGAVPEPSAWLLLSMALPMLHRSRRRLPLAPASK